MVTVGGATTVKQDVSLPLPVTFVAVTVTQWLPGGNAGLVAGAMHGETGDWESHWQSTRAAAPPPRAKFKLTGEPTVEPLTGDVMWTVGGVSTVKQTVCVALPAAFVAVTLKQ